MPSELAIAKDRGIGRPVNISAIMRAMHHRPEAASLTLVKSPTAQMITMLMAMTKPTGLPAREAAGDSLVVVAGLTATTSETLSDTEFVDDMVDTPLDRLVFGYMINGLAGPSVNVLVWVANGEERVERKHDRCEREPDGDQEIEFPDRQRRDSRGRPYRHLRKRFFQSEPVDKGREYSAGTVTGGFE